MYSDTSIYINTVIKDNKQENTAKKEVIVRKHQPLIWSLAKRICCSWMSIEELVQAGNVGLLHAMRNYDSTKGTKLITYAVPWILGEMRKAMKASEYCACSLDERKGEEDRTICDALVGSTGVDIARVDLTLAFSKLSQETKLLLCLRYFQDKTQKETAVIMNKSQAQISRMESRALEDLQYLLR